MSKNLRLLIFLVSTFVLVGSLDLVCRSPSVEQTKNRSLNIILFVPLPDEDYDPAFDQGYSIIPAVEMAVEQINKRTDILPDHYFHLIVKDAGCDKATKTGIEMVALLRELLYTTRRGPIGFIGPACSEDSIFVANAIHRIHNQPVLYSGTTPHLSEHADSTPNAFGMVSSTAVLTDTLIRIVDKENWNWENIAVLYDNSREHFQQSYAAFVRALSNNSHHVGYTRQIAASQIPLAEVKERNIRIVVVFSSKEPAQQLACLAGQSTVNFIFPIYQFIFIEKSFDDFHERGTEFSFVQNSDGRQYYCDTETLMRGLNGSVLINQALDSVDPNIVTVSNYTAGQIKQQYKERVKECGNTLNTTLSVTSLAYPYYDTIWALAIGMDMVSSNQRGSFFEAVHNALLNNVSFQGVSSWIDFKQRHHVSNPAIIYQIMESGASVKGLWNKSALTYTNNTFISDEFMTVSISLHTSLAVLGLFTASVMVVVTVVVQTVMVLYRNYPSIKASSTRLNHFVYLGCYLFTASIVANTLRLIIPATNGNVLCNVDIMANILASSFIFGAILAKSWRTYKIFNQVFKTRSHYSLHDATLAIFILLLALLQGLLFIPLLVVSPFNEVLSFVYDSSQWPPVKRTESVCVTESVGYIMLPLIFQLCLILATVFLATLNRNVKRKNFRTTKQIIMLVYALTIMWTVGGPLLVIFYYLKFSVNVTYSFYTFLLLATVLLCLTFLILPYMLPALNKQKGTGPQRRVSSFRRSSTQLSILSLRKLSFSKNSFRRSSVPVQTSSNHLPSSQLSTPRRTSLPHSVKCQVPLHAREFRISSLQSSI